MTNYRRSFMQDHYLFITVVTKNRTSILIDNIELLRHSFKTVKQKYNFEIYGIVVLPDHIHMILLPELVYQYPKIIASIKWHFSRKLASNTELLSESDGKRREKGIWQRRYYEHTIRNDKELLKYLNYIHYNPVKHGYVENIKDWEYSSFKRFASTRKDQYFHICKSFYDLEDLEDLE